ncbi:hypothetical protein JL720_367 [Aureococcus anophagefferens]|nr:hypothetical protein JL720_367 [Aureococcus anophagefferens]
MSTCEAHKLTPTPRRKRGLSVAGTASRHVFLDPSLVELVLEACVSLNDVKLLSGVSRATRRARWPFETLSGHVGIRAMIARSGDDTSFENWARTAEAPKLSDANIAAMVEQLSSYRAMAASGGLLRQLCPGCTQTLREGLGASCARAAFSLGYSCVRSESGWSNAHAIIGACGHASLFAVAFGESDDLDASRSAGWGPKEACAWALVQLLSVAKKRMSCKALVAQLRQLGVARACADAVLAPLPMLEAGQSKRRASSVGRAARAGDHLRAGSRDYATSDAPRELGAQLLYLTSTGDPDYVDQVSACPLERLVSFACDFGHKSTDGRPDARRRARHAAQFAVTHGLHLPQDDDRSASRKLSFARHVVDAAEAVADAAAAKRCTAEARPFAALALVADSCPDELVNVGAPRVSLYLAECDAAAAEDDDEELLNHMLDGEHGLTPQQQQQLQQQRANRTSRQAAALVDCPAALARRAVEHLGGLGPPPRTHPGPWLHAVDSLAAFVPSRAGAPRDAEALLGDRANLAFVDVLLKVERRAQAHRPLDDDRFFYGADRVDQGSKRERNSQLQRLISRPFSARVDTTVFGVLSALAKLPRGREELVNLGGHDLLPALDAAPDADDLDDDDLLDDFPIGPGGDAGDDDDDDDDDLDSDGDDDDDDDNIYLVLDGDGEDDDDDHERALQMVAAAENGEDGIPDAVMQMVAAAVGDDDDDEELDDDDDED